MTYLSSPQLRPGIGEVSMYSRLSNKQTGPTYISLLSPKKFPTIRLFGTIHLFRSLEYAFYAYKLVYFFSRGVFMLRAAEAVS